MAPRETKPAKLDPRAHEALGELQTALGRHGLPGNVERTDILSALVLYITAPQVAGMLAEYWRDTDRRRRTQQHAPPDADDG